MSFEMWDGLRVGRLMIGVRVNELFLLKKELVSGEGVWMGWEKVVDMRCWVERWCGYEFGIDSYVWLELWFCGCCGGDFGRLWVLGLWVLEFCYLFLSKSERRVWRWGYGDGWEDYWGLWGGCDGYIGIFGLEFKVWYKIVLEGRWVFWDIFIGSEV